MHKFRLFWENFILDLASLAEYAVILIEKLADILEIVFVEAMKPYWVMTFVFLAAFLILVLL